MIEKFKKNLPLVAVLLGIFAFCTFFCSAVSYGETDLAYAFNGYEVAFGKEYESYGYSVDMFKFSFMALVTYLLPLAGVVCIYFADAKNNNKLTWAAMACFVVGTILFFLMPFLSAMSAEMKELDDLKLGSGAIIGALSCLAAALCLAPAVMKEFLQPAPAAAAPAQEEVATEAQNEEVAE